MPAIFLFPYTCFHGNNHYISEVPEYSWNIDHCPVAITTALDRWQYHN